MIGFLHRLFARGEPALSEATPRDAAAIAALHGKSFHRGWSDSEIEILLVDRSVIAHRATAGRSLVGFILSRMAADEAEILSVAVAPARRGRGHHEHVPIGREPRDAGEISPRPHDRE